MHTITIPSATRYLEDVRKFIAKHAKSASFPAEAVHNLQLAVDECCANVIEHAYSGADSYTIDVDVVVKSDRLTVRVRDEGLPFVDSRYREPDIFEYAARKRSGGFGVHLMRKLADQVEYTTRGKSNVCSLTMYRENARSSEKNAAARGKNGAGARSGSKSGSSAGATARKRAAGSTTGKTAPKKKAPKKSAPRKSASKKPADKGRPTKKKR